MGKHDDTKHVRPRVKYVANKVNINKHFEMIIWEHLKFKQVKVNAYIFNRYNKRKLSTN